MAGHHDETDDKTKYAPVHTTLTAMYDGWKEEIQKYTDKDRIRRLSWQCIVVKAVMKEFPDSHMDVKQVQEIVGEIMTRYAKRATEKLVLAEQSELVRELVIVLVIARLNDLEIREVLGHFNERVALEEAERGRLA